MHSEELLEGGSESTIECVERYITAIFSFNSALLSPCNCTTNPIFHDSRSSGNGFKRFEGLNVKLAMVGTSMYEVVLFVMIFLLYHVSQKRIGIVFRHKLKVSTSQSKLVVSHKLL